MITKLATFSGVSSAGEPLVHLVHPGEGLRKHAGMLQPPVQEWLESYSPEAGKIALLVSAMGASEYWGQNNNGDAFGEGALAHDCSKHPKIAHPYDDFAGKVIPPYGYPTFLEAHAFMHHRNKDPTRAFGRPVVSCYNPKMHRIELVVVIDEELAMAHGAQSVVDRIKAGEYPDVSMGTRVPYDQCLVCGHKARTCKEYCSCIKHIGMNKILEDGRQIGVDNPHPRFFDLSFVFIGADRTAKMMCKLAAAQNIPLSVMEADEVYNIPYTADGLIKAACAKSSCTECRGGCKVAQVDWDSVRNMGLAGGLGGAIGMGAVDLLARRKLDPRLLTTMGRAAGEWGVAGGVTGGVLPLVKMGADKEASFGMAAPTRFSSPLKYRAVIGALTGGATGAGVGAGVSEEGHRGAGALLGAGSGAALGALGALAAGPIGRRIAAARATRRAQNLQSKASAVEAEGEVLKRRGQALAEAAKKKNLSTEEIDVLNRRYDKLFEGREAHYKKMKEGYYPRINEAINQTLRAQTYRGADHPVVLDLPVSMVGGALLGGAAGAGTAKALQKEGALPLIKTGAVWPDDPEAQQVIVKDMADRIRAAAREHHRKNAGLRSSSFSAEVHESGTGIPTKHVRMRGESENGRGRVVATRLAPPPVETVAKEASEAKRMSPEEARAFRLAVRSWMDQTVKSKGRFKGYGEGVAHRFSSKKEAAVRGPPRPPKPPRPGPPRRLRKRAAAAWKIGPPPMPNREKYPFVGTINFRGLKIGVENAPGTWRTGTGWKTLMKVPYGEFLHGKAGGTDGDKLDVYVGPSRNCENVYIVHQNFVRGPNKGKYDEDKVLLGFDTPAQAKRTYLAHYDSDKYFRSMTTMAFPLFKRAVIGGEVDGEKVARLLLSDRELDRIGRPYSIPGPTLRDAIETDPDVVFGWGGSTRKAQKRLVKEWVRGGGVKVAAKLEDLFSTASGAERRKRTWRDKVTGEEETVTGSGLKKEASAARPEVVKLAMVLKHGFGPGDLLKVSNHPKTAAHLKWADIIKEVGPSKAVGRVAPLLEATEPDLPDDLLDDLGERPCLEESLSSPAAMGMVLKPREFQRIVLVRMGRRGLADELDRAGAVFPSCERCRPICNSLTPDHVSGDILDRLAPFLGERSYFGPVVRRRIIRIATTRPRASFPLEMDTPLLTKVGEAYNWYRNEQLSMLTSPARIKTAAKIDPKTGLTSTGMALVLGSVPLALMYSVYKKHQKNKGVELGFLDDLAAEHPWFTSAGTGTLVAAALRNPTINKVIKDAVKNV